MNREGVFHTKVGAWKLYKYFTLLLIEVVIYRREGEIMEITQRDLLWC